MLKCRGFCVGAQEQADAICMLKCRGFCVGAQEQADAILGTSPEGSFEFEMQRFMQVPFSHLVKSQCLCDLLSLI